MEIERAIRRIKKELEDNNSLNNSEVNNALECLRKKVGDKYESLKNNPIIETNMTTSADGKWFIHRTIITDIKSRNYAERVLRQ